MPYCSYFMYHWLCNQFHFTYAWYRYFKTCITSTAINNHHHLPLCPQQCVGLDSYRILLLVNICNARRALYMLRLLFWLLGWRMTNSVSGTRWTCAGGFLILYLEPRSLEATETEQPCLCVQTQLRWKCSTVLDTFQTASLSLGVMCICMCINSPL